MLGQVQGRGDDDHAAEEEDEGVEDELLGGREHVQREGDLVLVALALQPAQDGGGVQHEGEDKDAGGGGKEGVGQGGGVVVDGSAERGCVGVVRHGWKVSSGGNLDQQSLGNWRGRGERGGRIRWGLLLRRTLGCASGGACGSKGSGRKRSESQESLHACFRVCASRPVPNGQHSRTPGHALSSALERLMMAAQFARHALYGVRRTLHHPFLTTTTSRSLSTTSVFQGPKPLPPRPTINEDDITESFLKGSGPGGQKINKTSSAVQLKHLPTGIVVKYQGTRSRTQNRKVARRMLAERLEEMEKGDESRTQIKRAAQAKKKASKAKKSKRKYRALEEAKKAGATGEEPTEEAVNEDEEWEDVELDPPNEKENEKKTEQQDGRPNNP